jgi:hypothetical protein
VEGDWLEIELLGDVEAVPSGALANLQPKHMIEGDELAKHLSAMLRRYPRMIDQFARPDTQHDLLYDGFA